MPSAAKPPSDVTPDRLRLLVDAVLDYGIFMLDPQGHVVSWNAGAQRLKGYRAEEAIGRHFSVFYTDEANARGWPQEELRRAIAHGRFEDEGWRVRKDGSLFWANVVITALRDAGGELVGFAKVTRDLTERRRHEEALRESEERFRLLVGGVRDYAIFMLSPEGVIESWNEGAQLIKGYTEQEVLGRHFSLFYRPEDLKADLPGDELRTALATGRAEREGWRVRKDGSQFWANVVLSPVYDADKQLRGFAKVTRDMSERRRLEELESSGQRMNEFLAMLAHELRNPLAPIRNAVTVLQLEPAPSPMVRSSRDMIDRQLTHMTRLVDDLLDVGRMSTGKVRLRKERLLYNQVVARAAEAARPLLDARHHRFIADVPSADIHVVADGTRLAQVVQNLLTNAAKYTPPNGEVRLTVRVEGSQLITSISDNGTGLSPASIGQIFELFAQGDGPADAKDGGLGIGLTLAKSLVEMHGGVLKAESPGPGLGSTFSFSVPNAGMEERNTASQAEASLRLLIVDDNRDAADSLAEVLRLMGCSVKIAYDGLLGLALAAEYKPHAALIDLGMPGMSGYELIQQLRLVPGGAQLMVSAITGYGNEEDRHRTGSAGFDAHLMKPVDFSALSEFLERVRTKRVAA